MVVDIREVVSLSFSDMFLWDSLTIIYKNGRKQVYRTVGPEARDLYFRLKNKMDKNQQS